MFVNFFYWFASFSQLQKDLYRIAAREKPSEVLQR